MLLCVAMTKMGYGFCQNAVKNHVSMLTSL